MFYSTQDGKKLPETTVENIEADTEAIFDTLETQIDATKFNQSIGKAIF